MNGDLTMRVTARLCAGRIRFVPKRVAEAVFRRVSVLRAYAFRFAVAWLCGLLAACTADDRVERQLDHAEQFAFSAPDSARVLLEAIGDDVVWHRRTKARYALLYTEVLYNCGRPLPGDSLIRYAWDYYKEHSRESRERYKTLYYLGCAELQEGDRQDALRHFLEVEEILHHTPEARYMGFLYLHVGDIHYDEADFRQADYYFGESLRCFRQVEDRSGEVRALCRRGAVANKLMQIGSAIRYYTEAFDLADDLPDETLVHECLKNLVPLYFIIDKDVPPALMQRIEAFAYRGGDHMLLDVQLLRHRPDSARYYLRRMKGQIDGVQDHIDYHHAGYWVEVFSNDTRAATHHLQRYLFLRDSVALYNFRTSAGEIRQDYLQERLRFAEYKMHNRTWWFVVAILTFLLLALSVYYNQRRKLRMQQMRNDSYLQSAKEAQEAYRALYERTNKEQAHPKDLTAAHFRVLERIGRTYYEQDNSAKQKEAIYQEVKRIIDDISADTAIRQELEQIVDGSRQNAMRRLRSAYPSMKESDLRLLCYVFCGFSSQIISLFMHETVENVYARKSRLKSRIKASDSSDRDFFLQLFR